MKEKILNSIGNPELLEKLYRENKSSFKAAFNLLYPEIRETITGQIWFVRLNAEPDEISWGARKELVFVLVISFLAGLIAKIPDMFNIDHDYFFQRNIGFVVFPLLIAYFAWKRQLKSSRILPLIPALLVSVFYINLLPANESSDTLFLACIHLPLFLWTLLGFTYIDGDLHDYQKRLDFLRYNGDLAVMTVVILIAGGLLTGITIGLFQLIQVSIEEFYFRYIGIWGLAASPLVASYLVSVNPQLVSKVSPVIAKVFTPLVLVMLLAYLGTVLYTGKDPYNDREFLLTFNLLLAGVMALIFFSIAETSGYSGNRAGILLLLVLSAVTVVVNMIALSAILFRISEWGVTPNRLAVLGSNILILINLVLVAYRLFGVLKHRRGMERVGQSITYFLPVYSIWTALVIFVFPLLFGFR